MTYKRFEDLPVWKEAIKLAEETYAFCDAAEQQFRRRSGLKSQIERAALSVSNNIAEGFERGTTNELINFIYIARGSAGEVRSMLWLVSRQEGFNDFKSEISNLKLQAESCSKQLRAWAQTLQDSDIKGQRHLSDQTRAEYEQQLDQARRQHEKEEFLREIEGMAKESRGF